VEVFSNGEDDLIDFADWSNVAIVNPEVVRKLSLEIYYNKFYDPDRGWRPLDMHTTHARRDMSALLL
jgi:hypothetical protein